MGYASQKIGSTQVSKKSNVTNIRFHQHRNLGKNIPLSQVACKIGFQLDYQG